MVSRPRRAIRPQYRCTTVISPNQRGGHSQRRIIHAADATGRAVSKTLGHRALEAANIDIYNQRVAINLIINGQRCQGAYVLNRESEHVDVFQAKFVVLATGGASKPISIPATPMVPVAMVLLWLGVRVVG